MVAMLNRRRASAKRSNRNLAETPSVETRFSNDFRTSSLEKHRLRIRAIAPFRTEQINPTKMWKTFASPSTATVGKRLVTSKTSLGFTMFGSCQRIFTDELLVRRQTGYRHSPVLLSRDLGATLQTSPELGLPRARKTSLIIDDDSRGNLYCGRGVHFHWHLRKSEEEIQVRCLERVNLWVRSWRLGGELSLRQRCIDWFLYDLTWLFSTRISR